MFGFGTVSARAANASRVTCALCLESARAVDEPVLDLGCACERTSAHERCALDAHGARLSGVARGRAMDRDWTLTWTCDPCDACGCEFSRDAVSALARRAVSTLAAEVARAADGSSARATAANARGGRATSA